MTNKQTKSVEEVAKQFHDTYERLAPQFGYETREDTKKFDPESPNGKLMIAVCDEIVTTLIEQVREERDREIVEILEAQRPASDNHGEVAHCNFHCHMAGEHTVIDDIKALLTKDK